MTNSLYGAPSWPVVDHSGLNVATRCPPKFLEHRFWSLSLIRADPASDAPLGVCDAQTTQSYVGPEIAGAGGQIRY